MVEEKIKNNKKAKVIIVFAAVIVVAVLMVGLFAAHLVFSFVPSEEFEGMWQGGINIKEVEKDASGYYDDIKNKNIGLIVDIDEQSKGYGHIRLRTEGGKPLGDELFPCVFKNGMIEVNNEELETKLKILVDHGRTYLDGDFVLKKLHEGAIIRGSISVEKMASGANIFDFGIDEVFE